MHRGPLAGPEMTREEFFAVPEDPVELRRRFIVLMRSYAQALAETQKLVEWVGEQGAKGRIVTLGEKCQEPYADAYLRWAISAPERAGFAVPLDKAPGVLIARDAKAELGLG